MVTTGAWASRLNGIVGRWARVTLNLGIGSRDACRVELLGGEKPGTDEETICCVSGENFCRNLRICPSFFSPNRRKHPIRAAGCWEKLDLGEKLPKLPVWDKS